MERKVVWTERASGDIEAIVRYIVDVELWIEMLDAAGMDQDARRRWHSEFERRCPEGHQEFLLSLGIQGDEVERIQRWSRGEMDRFHSR
jgi:plasmid stabilization system protein ParE